MNVYIDRGVRLFKFDFNIFLFWQDASYTDKLSAYRSFYQAVRELTPDAVLVGCGVPLFESIGLFDYIRVTKDVKTYPVKPSFLSRKLQALRDEDIKSAIDVREPFDALLWHADYDQIDSVRRFSAICSDSQGDYGVLLAGFNLDELL